eukprot:5078917-Amphidinium_carterae.1
MTPGVPVGTHSRGIVDQSVQSGLRLVGSWLVAHSFECPLDPFDSRGAGWQPTQWSARLSQGFRANVRIMDSVKVDVNFELNFRLTEEVSDVLHSHDIDVVEGIEVAKLVNCHSQSQLRLVEMAASAPASTSPISIHSPAYSPEMSPARDRL